MNERKKYWSDEEFIMVVSKSKSVSEVLKYFGLAEQQPHYRKRFYYDIKRLNLVIEYGTCQDNIENDGKAIKPNYKTKKALIKKGLLKNECSICLLNEWLNKPLSLHMDHIDGNRNNNNISNLRLLCPNCHSQTETYCNRNIKNNVSLKPKVEYFCVDCNKPKLGKHLRCLDCYKQYMSINIIFPHVNIMLLNLVKFGYAKYARKLGVTIKIIKYYLTRNNIVFNKQQYSRLIKHYNNTR